MKRVRPITKYHGGKGRLFQWIVPLLPKHEIYCEPFGGAASVLLNKPKSGREIFNDLEPSIFNLMKVVRDKYEEFLEIVINIPYERSVYEKHRSVYFSDSFSGLSDVERAVTTYVSKRMSRGGLCGTFCWSDRMYSTGPAEVHCWNSSFKNLPLIHERLQGVEMFNRDGLEVIRDSDSVDTLFYVDPPYLHSTRSSPNLYIYEMKQAQHESLLECLVNLKGRVALSGYRSKLYDEKLNGWQCITKDTANHSSHLANKERKTECLWVNY